MLLSYQQACAALKIPRWSRMIQAVAPLWSCTAKAASLLTLTHPGSGLLHFGTSCDKTLCCIGCINCHRSCTVSLTHITACCRLVSFSPFRLLMRLIHGAHIPHKITAESFLEQMPDIIRSVAQVSRVFFLKNRLAGLAFGIFTPILIRTWCQNSLMEQSRKTWSIDSSGAPHTSQQAIGSVWPFQRICLAAKNS